MKHEVDIPDTSNINFTEARSNAEDVFGVDIPAGMVWALSVKSSSEIDMGEAMKVQILNAPPFSSESVVLAEGYSKCILTYDVPAGTGRLYTALYDKDNVCKYIKGMNAGDNVSFAGNVANTRRASEEWSDEAYKIVTIKQTHNTSRRKAADAGDEKDGIGIWKGTNWADNVYEPSVAGTPIANMTEQEAADLKAILDAYLSHEKGWNTDNIEKIRNAGIFKYGVNYLIASGDATVQVRPIQAYSSEANKCTLYFYILEGDNIDEDYIKALPKYKICSFSEFQSGLPTHWDGVMYKYVYSLPYFTGEGFKGKLPAGNVFPKGTKIGFMMRKTASQTNIYQNQNGDLYSDGRLNKQINVWGNHFATAQMNPEDPRMAVIGINGKVYITVEDGSNRNFSDEIFEVSPGIEIPGDPIEPEYNEYTFMFEDNIIGDYDMNDVVIVGKKLPGNKVQWTVKACGANDELYIMGINDEISRKEVHSIFGAPRSVFVNTVEKNYDYVSFIVDVDTNFSFENNAPAIYNATRGYTLSLPRIGGAPFGVMIPGHAPWAKERICIKNAYPRFTKWITNDDTTWWKEPDVSLTLE